VQSSFSFGQDILGWRQYKTTAETLGDKVNLRRFALGNNEILARDCTALDTAETEYNVKLKNEVEGKKVAQNRQGPRRFVNVAGLPITTCY
jgi:hypothetical protein